LSPYFKSVEFVKRPPQFLTFPLGGFVNQRVHVFRRGCLTLKFSASWKTVIFSPFAVAFPSLNGTFVASSFETCEPFVGAGATSAIVCECSVVRKRNSGRGKGIRPVATCADLGRLAR